MKFRHFLMAALCMGAAILSGCSEKEEDLGEPSLSVSPSTLSFDSSAGPNTVTINASRAWQASTSATWIAIEPKSGDASKKDQTITISVLANTSVDRTADVLFDIGFMKQKVTITQKGTAKAGSGTKEDPFCVSAAVTYISSLSADVTVDNVYVKGLVSQLKEFSADFGNYTYYISDDGTTDNQLYVFRGTSLGGVKFKSAGDLKLGDEVVVYGPVVYFKGDTPEFTTGNKLWSLNGTEFKEQTEITQTTVAKFIESDGATYYRLTGKVTNFSKGTSSSSGKKYMQFNLTDDTGTILVYGFKDGQYEEWAGKIENGGTVTLTGTYEYYSSKNQHEVMNTTIESFEPYEQTGITDATVADFIKSDGYTYYRLTGVVTNFETTTSSDGNTNYMHFDLTDDTGTILVYGFKDGQYEEWAEKIKNHGTVTLTGTYEYYSSKNQHEVMNATIESFTEAQSPYCSVSPEAISVGAAEGSTTFQIEANAAWTAVSDNEAFTVSPASGSENASVTVSFTANDSQEERTANIKVTCEDASFEATVTITQKGKAAEGSVTLTKTMADMWKAIGVSQSGEQHATLNLDDVATLSVNADGNNGKLYGSADSANWRLYQTNSAVITLSVTDGYELVSVIFKYTVTNTGILLDGDKNAVNSGDEISLSGSSASWSVGNSGSANNGQVRITEVTVTYKTK